MQSSASIVLIKAEFLSSVFREGGNRALVVGFLADANFEVPKTLFLKAFRGLKIYLD